MKHFLRFFVAVCGLALCAGSSFAQFTLVSGTVTDPNGLPWACGSISAQLVNNNGVSATLNGVSFSGFTAPVKLGCPTDPSTSRTPGFFQMQLADNTVIKCGIATCGQQTTWLFTVNTIGIAPPQGTGPQSFTQAFTISGASQTLAFTGVPALGLGSSTSSAPAVQSGHIFMDPTCPQSPAGGTNGTCWFWNGNVRIYVDATTSNGSQILTISGGDTSFLSTETLNNGTTRPWIKVNQRIICSTNPLNGSMVVGARPGGVVVTSIDSATQIHISSNALSNQVGNAFCAIGDDDTPNINAFWNSGLIGQCGVNGFIAQGIGFFNSGIFNTVTAACLTKFNNQYSQPGLFGAGLGGTTFMPLETFDFTTGAGNSCQGGGQIAGGVTPPSGARTMCIGDFFSEMAYINVWGLGLTPVTTGLNVSLAGGNSRFNTDSFQGWMGNYVGSGAVYGLVENGNQVRVAQSCSCQFGEVAQVMNAQSYQIGNFTFGGLTDIQAIPGSGGTQPSSSYTSTIGPTNGGAGGAEISINSGAIFNDFGDHIISSNTDLAAHFVAAGGTGNVYSTVITVGGAGIVFKGNGAGAVTRVQDSAMTCSGAGCTEINMAASATFYDHGGNTWATFGTAFAGAGNVADQLSADVGPCVTANWALTSGWGTSTVASVGTNGNSHRCKVNITGAAGAASPVLTWTFPTAYPNVAPTSCTITQVGGTFGVLTNPVVGTPTGGSVAFTFSGTPAANTYIFDVSCGP